MDFEGLDLDLDLAGSASTETLEYVEMTTDELAAALREGAVIYAEPTHDLRFEVSLEGVLQVVIAAVSNEGTAHLRHAVSACLGGTVSATVEMGVAIPLDGASFDRAQAALLLRAMDALASVTGS
jgi:hypothetical protein